MKVYLRYNASNKLCNEYIVNTGRRLSDEFVTVEMEELTQATRAIIVECGIDHAGKVSLPLKVKRLDTTGYGSPSLTHDANSPSFDKIPTVAEWLAVAAPILEHNRPWLEKLEVAKLEKAAAEKVEEEEQDRLQNAYKAMQEEWLPKIAAMTEAEANQLFPDQEIYKTEQKLKWITGHKLTTVKSDRYDSLLKARLSAEYEAAKNSFVNAHGSDRLRRAVERGHDCKRLYTVERAAHEAPGFVVDIENDADWKSRSCPSVGALNAADAAEKLGLGSVEIVWLTAEPNDKPAHERKWGYDFDPCEALLIRRYLGEYDLIKIL